MLKVEPFNSGHQIIEIESACNIGIIEILPWSDVESDENNLRTIAHHDDSCKIGRQSYVGNSDAYHFHVDQSNDYDLSLVHHTDDYCAI